MLTFDESELKKLLACYTVAEPPESLVERTRERMYREQAALSVSPAPSGHWVLVLTGAAVLMGLCLFYTLMVETILQLFVPAGVIFYLQKSLIVLTAAGGSIIAGLCTLLALRYFMLSRTQEPAYEWSGEHTRNRDHVPFRAE